MNRGKDCKSDNTQGRTIFVQRRRSSYGLCAQTEQSDGVGELGHRRPKPRGSMARVFEL